MVTSECPGWVDELHGSDNEILPISQVAHHNQQQPIAFFYKHNLQMPIRYCRFTLLFRAYSVHTQSCLPMCGFLSRIQAWQMGFEGLINPNFMLIMF